MGLRATLNVVVNIKISVDGKVNLVFQPVVSLVGDMAFPHI
jgi:hypothetical protein